jgi:hypothetical protein
MRPSNSEMARGLGYHLLRFGKLAKFRPKPAKEETEGKERVEQRTERQRTGRSEEPRMQIIYRCC